MKLAAGRVEGFLRRPDAGIAAVLLYGPDSGLVRERLDALTKAVAGDKDDPFRVVELPASTLKDDPARLSDEAAALSLTGGRRVVRIRDAGDSLAELFKGFLAAPLGDGLVVVEASDLAARSSLRKVFEAAPSGAALACYADEGRGLEQVIRDTLATAGKSAVPDCLAYLVERLGGDRLVTRSEVEKLILYMGTETRISLEDAMDSVGDSAAISLDDIAFAVASGDQAALDRVLARAFQEGIQPVGIVRAVIRHFQRLHLVAGQIQAGRSADSAFASLKPPVFFKLADRFRAQVRAWPPERLADALGRLTAAEIDCKTTGLPATALCGRRLMELTQAARRLRG